MQEFIVQNPWVIYLMAAWTLPWKGIALWKAAKNNQKIWFIIIFLLNTLAILDIIYIMFVGKEKKEEKKEVKNGPTILSNGKRII
jgi:methionyl-tRNA synthetase